MRSSPGLVTTGILEFGGTSRPHGDGGVLALLLLLWELESSIFSGGGGSVGSTRKEGTRASVAFTKIGFETLWLAPDGNWAGGPGLAIGYPSQGGKPVYNATDASLEKKSKKW